jgi:cell division protein FtsQ
MTSKSRSDLVRSKKNRRLKPMKRKSRSMDMASPPSMPPIKTRMNSGTTTHSPYTQAPPLRKKMNFAIGNTGAEMDLPGIPKFNIGWRLISAILSITTLWALINLWNNPVFNVVDVQMIGLKNLSSYEINLIMDVIEKPIFMVDANSLENKLTETFPALTAVDINVEFPAQITVSVAERLPALVWKQDGIMDWWVDLEGIRFPALTTEEKMIIVYATAPPPKLYIDVDEEIEEIYTDTVDEDQSKSIQLLSSEMVDAILFLYLNSPENNTLIYDETHGLGWRDLDKNWKVYFGHKPDQMQSRLSIYESVVDLFVGKSIRPVLISIEYIHAPYYRLEEYAEEITIGENPEIDLATKNEGEN